MQDMGDGLECRVYDNMLALPLDISLAWILMCTSLGVGLLGVALAAPGLRLVTGCPGGPQDLSWKRKLKLAGGALCLLTGVLVAAPVSYVAHLIIRQFFDETLPDALERWELGEALFCGWVAGFLFLLGGALLLLSCQGGANPAAPAPGGHQERPWRREYV